MVGILHTKKRSFIVLSRDFIFNFTSHTQQEDPYILNYNHPNSLSLSLYPELVFTFNISEPSQTFFS